MSDNDKKKSRFREVERKPDPRIVEELEDMLKQAQAGKIKTFAAFYDVEGEELAISQFIEVGDNTRTRLQYMGQFFMGALTMAIQIIGTGETK